MEKYRKWTDQRVGVNPFVQAKKESLPLSGKLLRLIAQIIKGIVFIFYLPIFVFFYSLPLAFLKQFAARVMLYLLGVYSIQDFSVEKQDKNGSCPRILSNHSCFIDIVYYLYKYPSHSFLGFAQGDDQKVRYFLISPLKAFLTSLSNVQPFYVKKNIEKYNTLPELIKEQYKGISKNAKMIIFYEKIRTNGKGNIRIDKDLCDDIYDLADDCLIMQIKYLPRRNELFQLTRGGLGVLLTALGTVSTGNNIKIRASKQRASDTHSSGELREAVSTMAAGPMLQTDPGSYFQFLDFFKKTQKQDYKLQ